MLSLFIDLRYGHRPDVCFAVTVRPFLSLARALQVSPEAVGSTTRCRLQILNSMKARSRWYLPTTETRPDSRHSNAGRQNTPSGSAIDPNYLPLAPHDLRSKANRDRKSELSSNPKGSRNHSGALFYGK